MTRTVTQPNAPFKRLHLAAVVLTLASFLFVWARPCLALDVPVLTGRVNDHADVLTPQAESELESRLATYEQQSGHQFALLTLRTLEGEAIEPFALRVVEAWKLGQKQKDDGLLMLVAVEDRRMRIEVGYGLEGNVPDTLAGRIIRNVMAPEFRKGDYGGGINKAFDALMEAASGREVQLPQATPKAKAPSVHGFWPLVWVAAFLLFGLFGGRRRGGLLFIPPIIGGGHHRGGGFSGGGGFRGGGGGFGGGGASGDW